jgi:c(7)-type cytochrome triheme protein
MRKRKTMARGAALALLGLLAAGASVVALALPDTVRIPQVKPRASTPPGALFSHVAHGTYRCYACHPSVFPQALQAFTHADMNAGRFCGSCHDGHEASAVNRTPCESCHAAR